MFCLLVVFNLLKFSASIWRFKRGQATYEENLYDNLPSEWRTLIDFAVWEIEKYAFNWLSKHPLNLVGSEKSEIVPNISNLVNSARRKLLDQSSNLAAAPYTGGPAVPISAVPVTLSSGAFPAVPNANKKKNQPPAPLHSPPHDASASHQHSTNGASKNLWKYIIIIIVVAVLVAVIIILLCIWRKRAAKIISPWKTGISGQLQKAFITGNSSNKPIRTCTFTLSWWS